MSQHPRSSMYVAVFAALLVLTALTVGMSRLDIGRWHMPVGLLIATTKAGLVFAFFMHLYYSHKLNWLFALSALFWLAILLGLTMSDYVTRQDPTQERGEQRASQLYG